MTDDLLQAEADEDVAHMLLPLVSRIAGLRRERIRHARFGDVFVAVTARHFFENIRKLYDDLLLTGPKKKIVAPEQAVRLALEGAVPRDA